MSRQTVASTTTLQARFFVPLAQIGMILSKLYSLLGDMALTLLTPYTRTRTKLASGEMSVSGDQWPMFVYANLEYDSDDPWSGLFRNQILVWESILTITCVSC
jgi:hypothetical protein